jgi:hypothetical protein
MHHAHNLIYCEVSLSFAVGDQVCKLLIPPLEHTGAREQTVNHVGYEFLPIEHSMGE